ncbi:MAG: hypothetical protein WC178_03270 [Candidatus Paceibacterota bacterium]
MKKISTFLFLLVISATVFSQKALAVCPICTIAAAGGVGLSRYLGIDDAITGLWLGGVTVSFIMWTENWLDKKNIRFKGRIYANIFMYILLIIVPLYYSGIMGHPQNALDFLGIDKLLLGIVCGASAFWFGGSWYEYIKEKNGGHANFPFQKIVMPISPLVIISFIFYFLIK